MHIQIDYSLTGSGWAECKVSSEEQTCLLTASYLSNAFEKLVLAAKCALSGFPAFSFGFDEEPGEFRWSISSPKLNEIQIEILEFSELWGGRPDADGKLVYRSRCRPFVFADAVRRAAAQVLETHGERGYLDKWVEHPFPTVQYHELVKAIELHGDH